MNIKRADIGTRHSRTGQLPPRADSTRRWKVPRPLRRAGLAAAAALALTGCINEDLSKCGADVALRYDLRLSLDLRTELQTELTTAAEQQLAARLEERLAGVFTNQARDIDLSFFDRDDKSLYRHDRYTVNAGQASFTLYVEPRAYEHAALANTADMGNLQYAAADRFATLRVQQAEADTVDSQTTGIFSATAEMEVSAGQSQQFSLSLGMQNSAAILVLQPTAGAQPAALAAYVRDMATGYTPSDSTFTGYDRSPVVRTLRTDEAGLIAFHAVCFPSADGPETRGNGDVSTSGEGLWRMEVYATLADGSTTRSTLHVKTPLPAGRLKVIKARLNDNGQVVTSDQSVGVSVELDWKPGGNHEVEI